MADFEDSAARYEGKCTPAAVQSLTPDLSPADERGYERRDRSASPRGDREERNRSRSPNGRDRPYVSDSQSICPTISLTHYQPSSPRRQPNEVG